MSRQRERGIAMRDGAIKEIAIREVSAFCGFADMAYRGIDRSGGQLADEVYFLIHSFLDHCGTVARLLWSPELAEHAGGRTIAQVLEVPRGYRFEDETVREMVEHYDHRLARGLATRGEVAKVLDYNIGDRDAFEEENSIFLRHYDPTVDTLTWTEEELPLQHLAAELADIRDRAEAWLKANAVLEERPATASIPPRP